MKATRLTTPILATLMLIGCTNQAQKTTSLPPTQSQAAANVEPTKKPKAQRFRFLALGDSYTIGEGVTENQRWPNQLARLLKQTGEDQAEPRIIARTGWTTDELARAIKETSPDGPYDLVSLLIGVNDQYRGRPAASYTSPFADLLATSIHLAGDRPRNVLVLSIPDWGVTAFAQGRNGYKIAAEIDAYNEIARGQTLAAGAHWVDVTKPSRDAGSTVAQLSSDGLHPSGLQYATWARLALPAATAALSR